jgi:hypothetical protein
VCVRRCFEGDVWGAVEKKDKQKEVQKRITKIKRTRKAQETKQTTKKKRQLATNEKSTRLETEKEKEIYMAYFVVHSFAVLVYFSRSVL